MAVSKTMALLKLGRIHYKNAWEVQKALQRSHLLKPSDQRNVHDRPQDVLILCEHEPVYTIGIRTAEYPQQEQDRLKSLGADFVKTDRGGLITFHGPGQLVAYPIINLKNYNFGVRRYVSSLEKVLIQTCAHFGLSGRTTKDTGVWIETAKIAAIGISCKRYITQHGVSLNCSTDLSWFNHVVPCGIEGKGVTSLSKELQREVTVEETEPIFLNAFREAFNCEIDYEGLNKDTVIQGVN